MGQMIQASLTRRMGLRKMGRRSEPPSGRPKKRRERRSRFLIVCGGKVTEPSYFRVLKADLGLSNAVDVRPVPKDPLPVVRDAIKIMDIDRNESEREGFDRFREVWVIVDCDNFCNLQQAQAKARESGIRLVISNPCFEVWLIDHVRVCPSFSDIRKCEDMAKDLGLVRATDRDRTSTRKAKEVVADSVSGKAGAAVQNASKHNDDNKRKARIGNPNNVSQYRSWTDMPEVVQSLMDESHRLGGGHGK